MIINCTMSSNKSSLIACMQCILFYISLSTNWLRTSMWVPKLFAHYRDCILKCVFLVYNYFIWSMIQRGSDTSFTNLWSLLLYLRSLLHYIENAQENKKNTILSYNIAENSKRVKRNEEKVCVCVLGCWMVFG